MLKLLHQSRCALRVQHSVKRGAAGAVMRRQQLGAPVAAAHQAPLPCPSPLPAPGYRLSVCRYGRAALCRAIALPAITTWHMHIHPLSQISHQE